MADRSRAEDVAGAVVAGARGLVREGDGIAARFGASIGIACVSSPTDERLEAVVSRADAAMYAAKRKSKKQSCRGAWHVETQEA